MIDHRSYALNLSSWENKAWKKIQAWRYRVEKFRPRFCFENWKVELRREKRARDVNLEEDVNNWPKLKEIDLLEVKIELCFKLIVFFVSSSFGSPEGTIGLRNNRNQLNEIRSTIDLLYEIWKWKIEIYFRLFITLDFVICFNFMLNFVFKPTWKLFLKKKKNPLTSISAFRRIPNNHGLNPVTLVKVKQTQ